MALPPGPWRFFSARSFHRKLSLKKISREYFALCGKLRRLIERIESETEIDVARIPLHLEDFIGDPEGQLSSVCAALGIEADEKYLRDCGRIVNKKPHRRRFEVEWDEELPAGIQRNLERFPFLRRYSFDD